MTASIYVIIVTHDSADVLPQCLAALETQTRKADRLIIVDSGSSTREYLEAFQENTGITCVFRDNIGFSRANNVGMQALPLAASGIVVFVNPDAFLHQNALAAAAAAFERHDDVAVVGGRLAGYDPEKKTATGKLDSTGVFRTWYGRWFDRGQGEDDIGQYDSAEIVPAVCGAMMCCRLEVLRATGDDRAFDEDFFLYKEDVELSLRLRKYGWKILYEPGLKAYHCRGWKKKRDEIPLELRLEAAKNEVLLYRKHPSPYIFWAIVKFLLVRVFHL